MAEPGPEPTTWIGEQKAKVRKDITEFELKDCPECRYIGGTGIIIAGAYVAFVGQKRVISRGGGVLARFPSAFVASLMMSLGAMRLLGKNPFTSGESEVGIDVFRKMFQKEDSGESSRAK